MNVPIELQAQEIAVPTKLGFLESSQEHMCMKAFKEHPRGLVAYEQRQYIYLKEIVNSEKKLVP